MTTIKYIIWSNRLHPVNVIGIMGDCYLEGHIYVTNIFPAMHVLESLQMLKWKCITSAPCILGDYKVEEAETALTLRAPNFFSLVTPTLLLLGTWEVMFCSKADLHIRIQFSGPDSVPVVLVLTHLQLSALRGGRRYTLNMYTVHYN